MSISKGRLLADPSAPLDGDSVVSYLRDGAGVVIGSVSDALKVSITNASLVVSATNLDIRDLVFATDKVDASGSTNLGLDAATLAALESITVQNGAGASAVNIQDGGNSITVDGTVELGATTLAALETITVLQGTSPWVVSATDLDIRDISHTQDSIKIGDGTDFLAVNADGSINVNATVTINSEYLEDAAHVSADEGLYTLGVRQDVPASSTSADGDYQSVKSDALGRAWANTGSNVAISNATVAVSTTALLVTALANRRVIKVLNVGNKYIAVGASGVSIANGYIIPAGASDEFEVGPNIALHAVAESGTQDVRVLQLA